MSTDKPGRVVFIGNIPYGLTEEQITQIFNSVGQVLSFRLVYDNESGRPKGFGFAEFADTDAAASAVRNLNNYQIMNRELRVDFSHVGGKDDAAPAGYQPQPPLPPNGYTAPPPSNGLGPLPPGVDLPTGLTCPDAISSTLTTLPPPQLLDILSQMKNLVMGDPNKATELLKQAPQLSYAIFQALLLMGLVDTSVLASVVEQAAQPPPQAPTPVQQIPTRPPPQYQPPPQQQYQPPPQPAPYQQYPQVAGHMPVATPPVAHQPYAPPPPPLPPVQQQPQPPEAAQQALLKQVLDMSQYEVDQLPPVEREQIMTLKRQFNGRIGY